MKIKDGFVLRTVSGQTVVLPVAEDLNLNMLIKLNDTGRFLWEKLQEETSTEALVSALVAEYNVEESAAAAHVETFVKELDSHGFLC